MTNRLGLTVGLGITTVLLSFAAATAFAANPATAAATVNAFSTSSKTPASPTAGEGGSSLEAVASKASETGRRVAMSLIALAFAIAGVLLAFRRDFRDAAGVFAVGIVAVLLVTPTGLGLIRATVNTLFGAR